MKTILAPIDFSPISDTVVAEAISLAKSLQARVVFFAAVQPPIVVSEFAPLLENIAEINAAGEKNAQRQLTKLEQKLDAEGIAVEGSCAVGAPISLIISQAEKCAADYIVMGSHGHTALYELLVGSTTHGVLLRAKCPVMIVPAVKTTRAKKARKHREAVLV